MPSVPSWPAEHIQIVSVSLEAPDMRLIENIFAEARNTMDESLPKCGSSGGCRPTPE